MYCENCGTKNNNEAKFCKKCGNNILETDVIKDVENEIAIKPQRKRKNYRKLFSTIGGIFIIIIVVSILGFISDYKNKKDTESVNNAMHDALNNTNTSDNKALSDVMKNIFSYYKQEQDSALANCTLLDKSDVLQTSSYATQANIASSIKKINDCISDIDNFQNNYDKMLAGAKDKIRNSNLSQSDISSAITEFDNSSTDATARDLRAKRFNALKADYTKMAELYNFLSGSFDDYSIEKGNDAKERIAFYTDSNLQRYNQFIGAITTLSQTFSDADTTYSAYVQKSLQGYGLDVGVNEITNYFNK